MPRQPTDDPLTLEFAELVRKRMAEQKLTITDLAARLEVPRQTVSEFLNHPSSVRTDTITKWFDALGWEPVLKGKKKQP